MVEESFDEVQPAGSRRGEMQVVPRVWLQLPFDRGGLAGGEVIHDQVHVEDCQLADNGQDHRLR
ncbi:hypothetical protein [Catellatospora chokoriensis]|uniref:Uncharacterized protein n=1 Tax=Catellatospora chokoriensis TaxID=310353 RepID=A0A8J3K8H3_9ACTN|nr:hypothetical protein [Catellatospora chokoriensis]GIF90444.1 hypothetical protein Cch02nite_38880 [Catellatospora chokoriensis]